MVYTTPYKEVKIKFNTLITSKIKRISEWKITVALHSFKHKSDAIEDAENECSTELAKCIIPKGSEYYYGLFDYKPCYASNQLIYIDIVQYRTDYNYDSKWIKL